MQKESGDGYGTDGGNYPSESQPSPRVIPPEAYAFLNNPRSFAREVPSLSRRLRIAAEAGLLLGVKFSFAASVVLGVGYLAWSKVAVSLWRADQAFMFLSEYQDRIKALPAVEKK